MEKHGQGTHSTKMGADKSAENTPNPPKFNCPRPKVWDFDEKRLHWASVVRVFEDVMYVTKNTSAFFCNTKNHLAHFCL